MKPDLRLVKGREFVVSLGRTASDPYVSTISVTWDQFINLVQVENTREGKLSLLEYLKSSGDIKSQEKDGPYFIPALFERNYRQTENIREISAFVCDFDKGISYKEIEYRLSRWSYLAWTTYSHAPDVEWVDDKGEKHVGTEKWRVVIPYSASITVSTHSRAYAFFQRLFKDQLDGACARPAQLWYLPGFPKGAFKLHRSNVHVGVMFNTEENLKGPEVQIGERRSEKRAKRKMISSYSRLEIEQFLKYISSEDYDTWYKVGMAINHELKSIKYPDLAFDIWHEWSTKQPGYVSEEDCRKHWRSFGRKKLKEPITGDTLRALSSIAKPAIVTVKDEKHKENPEIVERPAMLAERYNLTASVKNGEVSLLNNEDNYVRLLRNHPRFKESLWYNEDTRCSILDDKPLEDSLITQTLIYFQRRLSFPNAAALKIASSMAMVSMERSRSPLKDWIRNLQWDKTTRINKLFTKYAGAEDNEYHREASRNFLLGAIERLFRPGCKLDSMIILVSDQGMKKSLMWHTLFGIENVTDISGMTSDKDFTILIGSRWCANLEEMDAYRRRESSQLKALITSREDVYRPPYARYAQAFPRRSVMVGNTNDKQFLKEETNRREFPIEISRTIDIERLKQDREQIWAEAYYRRILGKEQYWDENGLKWEGEKIKFRKGNPYEEFIFEYFQKMKFETYWNERPVVQGTKIITWMRSRGVIVRDDLFGAAMRRMGWEARAVRGTSLKPKVTKDGGTFCMGPQKLWVRMDLESED